jgi:hypothetical protein
MAERELHLHSMIVHAVIGAAFVAALAYVVEAARIGGGGIRPQAWAMLLRGALVVLFVIFFPASLTGIAERNHMYAAWHPSHRAKLVLSLVLLVLSAAELAALAGFGVAVSLGSWLAFAVVVANPVLCLVLAHLGLRITLGRQAMVGTSYLADMDRDPSVDILVTTAAQLAEPARLIDVMEEHAE